jgi:hypothetical protein
MTHTTMTRRAAAAAARELLAQEVQDRAELVAALYDARLAVHAAETAAAAAQEQVRERRRSYAAARQAALAGGWTSDQLDNLGWTAEHTTRRPPRQRPAPRSSSPGDAHPAVAAKPADAARDDAGVTAGPPPAWSDGGRDQQPLAATSPVPHEQPVHAYSWLDQRDAPHP